MAMACLRLVTFFPLRPDFSLPCFISFISRSTALPAAGLYLRELVDFFDALFLEWLFFAGDFRAELFFAAPFFFVAIGPFLHADWDAWKKNGVAALTVIPDPTVGNAYWCLREAISITKRYFTSALTTRSKASLIF